MILFSNFALRFRNARKVINQIKAGDWLAPAKPGEQVYAAYRHDRKLWLANGAFFCDLLDPSTNRDLMAFGLLWRHWVWWAAARKLKSDAEKRALVKFNPPEL